MHLTMDLKQLCPNTNKTLLCWQVNNITVWPRGAPVVKAISRSPRWAEVLSLSHAGIPQSRTSTFALKFPVALPFLDTHIYKAQLSRPVR